MSKPSKSICRGCKAPIQWAQKDGKPHPYNHDGTSHFLTCPNRGAFVPTAKLTLRELSGAVKILQARGHPTPDLMNWTIKKIIDEAKDKEEPAQQNLQEEAEW